MELASRQKALEQKLQDDRDLRMFHARVGELLEGERRPELIQRAKRRVSMWEERRLCSSYYINQWSALLTAYSTEKFREVILSPSSSRSLALMQNSPFSFLMRELTD